MCYQNFFFWFYGYFLQFKSPADKCVSFFYNSISLSCRKTQIYYWNCASFCGWSLSTDKLLTSCCCCFFFKCTVDWSAAFGVYVCLFSQGEEAAVQRWLPHVPESPRCHDSESRPQGCVPGYEPAPQPLLHLLLSQHLPHGGSAQRPQQHRGVH